MLKPAMVGDIVVITRLAERSYKVRLVKSNGTTV
jgi:hypothetical protein